MEKDLRNVNTSLFVTTSLFITIIIITIDKGKGINLFTLSLWEINHFSWFPTSSLWEINHFSWFSGYQSTKLVNIFYQISNSGNLMSEKTFYRSFIIVLNFYTATTDTVTMF